MEKNAVAIIKKDLKSNSSKLINLANKLTIKTLVSNKIASYIPLDMTFIGIDFGTSTTVVSVATSKDAQMVVNANHIELNQKLYDGGIYKSYKIPTMIGWYNNFLLIGEGANQIKLKLKQGKTLWHSFKMELGEDVGAKYPESELNNEKIKILNPKDATTIFFKYLKVQIEKYVKENNLPSKIEYAVSIPASFESNQRKDLIDSLHANNMMLNKQALIDEPNAAFLSYVNNPNLKNEIYISDDYPTNVLVFDFGAGTCDISILEVANTPKGYFSKNLAISRFEALGGNDIDKIIATEILLPQFLNENNLEKSFFSTKELMQYILPKLEKPAELLKIKASEEIALLSDDKKIQELIKSNKEIMINYKVEIKSKRGTYTLQSPQLSHQDFYKINRRFTSLDIEYNENATDNENKSIFSPIFSALKKAHLEKNDIDYLLFIGGSSKNLFIQKALKNYFDETEYLIPQNLQSHVSAGAAIHSLMYNGYGKNIIDPITSEPIIVIIKDGNQESIKTLLKAGTVIPSHTINIDDLRPQSNNQIFIDIPICVGNKNKILHIIKVEAENGKAFDLNTTIRLSVSISVDKMLLIDAKINEEKINIEPLNPFSNQELSLKERKKFEAEKVFNTALAKNHGEVDKYDLIKLYEVYESLDFLLKAAESLEELNMKFSYQSLNNVGVAYSKAGDEDKAMVFYKKAMDKNPSAITASNIALKYKYSDKQKYKEWLKKSLDINPNYTLSLYLYGLLLIDNSEESKGKEMIQKAFDSWSVEHKNGYLSSHISWFISCAKYLNKYDLAIELEKKEAQENNSINDGLYNDANLISVKQ